ncbi:hypothetical protein [Ideonella sp. A 288]|uniref:hypothetical protein n=1 Tax=Ideonella sp. A 288 TaxID=1962181 RepID=UPI0018FE12A3|nr:hypothetical protein [Ideonella sp. A 288]
MNSSLHIRLQTTAAQNARLHELQQAFAQVCNTLAPLAQRTACWNRVALHHMAYRQLREQFPALGSQMVCNAIYSVSRACRLVYQHPASPFNVQRLGGRPLPVVQFQPQAPVYFDRHTLSLKDGQVSMYTLDGRMRFNLPLEPQDELRFRHGKLREIVLQSRPDGYLLSFSFAEGDDLADGAAEAAPVASEFPEYLMVLDGSDQGGVGLPGAAMAAASLAHAATLAPTSPQTPQANA